MKIQFIPLTLVLAMMLCSLHTSAQEFTRARKVGKAGCSSGSFFDLTQGGTCWTCPSGYNRTVASVTSNKACERPATTRYAKAINKGKGTGFFGTDCPPGAFLDPNGRCYTCPNGYSRTVHPVTGNKACEQRVPAGYTNAYKEGKAFCHDGSFIDPIQGGTCWTCPPGYKRSVYKVDGASGCVRE